MNGQNAIQYPKRGGGKEVSLWHWLEKSKIVIPRLQRDYAQGRTGKHALRERILKSIYEALNGKPVKLDFVYGTERYIPAEVLMRNDHWVISPLDGQQRLTTLWLVHWYLALRAGVIGERNVINRLSGFSYETRSTSRDFCRKLIESANEVRAMLGTEKIVDAICNQPWFSGLWKTDPTVDSMLRMLGGTETLECKDGIEKWFASCSDTDCGNYWELLTRPNGCPITFFYQSLTGLKDPDTLYVRMNARGKPLTSFENFKAELVELRREKSEGARKNGDEEEALSWAVIPAKLDNDWNDIFWTVPAGNKTVSTDDRYLAFINRLLFDDAVLRKQPDGAYEQKAGVSGLTEKTVGKSAMYRSFEGRCVYESFADYRRALDRKENFSVVLDGLSSLVKQRISIDEEVKCQAPTWFVGDTADNARLSWVAQFTFVPGANAFKSTGDYSGGLHDGITQHGRVWGLAIRRFVERVPLLAAEAQDKGRDGVLAAWRKKLHNWLRVVANIIENADIKTLDGTIRAMRVVDELSDHCEDILNFIANTTHITRTASESEQLNEEREKAARIIACPESIGAIEAAESLNCCRGAIRWLFRDSLNKANWDDFMTKCETIEDLFNTENGRSKVGAAANFALYWNESDLVANRYKKITFSHDPATWKHNFECMFESETLRGQLHSFLMQDVVSEVPVLVGKLVDGLNIIDRYWPEFGEWLVLTSWNCTVRGVQSVHRAVLTDYKVRKEIPNNGLFADLDCSVEEIKESITSYAEKRDLK